MVRARRASSCPRRSRTLPIEELAREFCLVKASDIYGTTVRELLIDYG